MVASTSAIHSSGGKSLEIILEPLDFVESNTVTCDAAFEVDWGSGSFPS